MAPLNLWEIIRAVNLALSELNRPIRYGATINKKYMKKEECPIHHVPLKGKDEVKWCSECSYSVC